MQAHRDIRILGGIGSGLLHVNVVERQLFDALARNILKMDGLLPKIFERQAIHVVARSDGIQYVRFEHGVKADAAQRDIVIGKYASIILEVLADFSPSFIFQQRF